jgi:hypothetical protein
MVGCLLKGEKSRGSVTGADRVVDRRRGALAPSQQVMMRKLGEVRVEVAGVEGLHCLADLPVKAHAPRNGQVVVDGIAD